MTDLTGIRFAAEKYLSELKGIKRVSENTLTAYNNDLSQFASFCEVKNITCINKITDKHLRSYLVYLSSEKYSKKSIARKLTTVRGLLNFSFRNSIINKNPAAGISNPKVEKKLPQIAGKGFIEDVYKEIDKEKENKEDIKEVLTKKAIFELLYGCSLRVSEICGLNRGSVDLREQTVKVLGKGGKNRIVPLGEKSLEILREYMPYIKDYGYSQPFFTTPKGERIYPRYVYRIVNKYLGAVTDISRTSPHVLRHSSATHMLDAGADLLAVKEILGHENLSTTQIYTRVSIDRLKQSYKKAHPKS